MSERVFVDIRWYAQSAGTSLPAARRRASRGMLRTEQPFRLGPLALRLVPAGKLPAPVRGRLDELLAERGLDEPDGGTIIVRGRADGGADVYRLEVAA